MGRQDQKKKEKFFSVTFHLCSLYSCFGGCIQVLLHTVIIMKTITSEFLRACTCPTQAHLSNTTLVRRGNDIPAHWFYRCPGAKFSHRRNNATIYNVISSYRDVFKRFLFRYIDRDHWYVCVTKYDFFLKLVSAQGSSISFVTLVTKIFFTVWVLNCKIFSTC